MKKQREHYTQEEKVAILRRRLLDKEPISKLCDKLGLEPTIFYRVSRRIHAERDRKLEEARKQRRFFQWKAA
jgi:transposase-like protein